MIQVKCPKCEKINRVSDEMAGKSTDCSICGLKLAVSAPGIDDANEESAAPHVNPKRGSNEDAGGADEDDRLDERKSKPKRKSKKRDSSESNPKSDEVDRPRKRKSKPKSGGELGERIEVFSPNVGPLRIVAIVCGILVAIGLLSCILTMIVSNMPKGSVLLAIIAIPCGLAGLLWCMNSLTLKVSVYGGGIVHSHRAQDRTILWENITSITQEIKEVYKNGEHLGTSRTYTLVLADFENIVYTDKLINDVERLAKIIVENTSAIILPRIRLEYQNGEVVKFGRLGISQKGLHYAKHILEWPEIEGVRIQEGYFTVSKSGKWLRWCKIEESSIPNLGLLLMFVDEIRGMEDR